MNNPVIIQGLRDVYKKHGDLVTPEVLIEEARPVTSPLHDSFDWKDGEAANKWRLQQARQLLAIKITIEPRKNHKVEVRLAMSLPTDRSEKTGYRMTEDVLHNVGYSLEGAMSALNRAYGNLRNFPHPLTTEAMAALDPIIAKGERQVSAAKTKAAKALL